MPALSAARPVLIRCALTLALLAAALLPARAQAGVTASKTLGISVFAGGMHLATDYNSTDYGVLYGADLTRHFRLFDPSLEVRGTFAGGNVVGEKTFTAGLRAGKTFGRLHPYADILVGVGYITFTHPVSYPTGPYASDNSLIYSFGGGLDYRVFGPFDAKVDYNAQSWRLGTEQNRLTPSAFSFGVLYHLPFAPRAHR